VAKSKDKSRAMADLQEIKPYDPGADLPRGSIEARRASAHPNLPLFRT
jgi:hypothetical protein